MEVPMDDETYTNSSADIQRIIENNLSNVEKSLQIYNKYAYVLTEDQKVNQFINEKPDRKSYTDKIQLYESLY